MQAFQHIDPQVLLQAAGNDAAAFAELSQTFLRIAPPMLARLQHAVPAADLPAAMREAHSLKSTAALIGAARLTRMAADLESRSQHGGADRQSWQPLLDALAQELACVMHEVRASIAPAGGKGHGARPA